MERSIWEPVILVALGIFVVALPWRVHLSTVRWPHRWLVLPDLLVSLTIVAATVWAMVTIIDGRSVAHVLPATITAVLAAGAEIVRSRSGLDAGTPVLPLWFVPLVLMVSAAGAIVWGVTEGSSSGAQVGVAALVMASPAAAILAVPVAFATGASRSRAQGVELGGLKALEASTRVDTLVLEKDGTVTTGDLTVVAVEPVEPDHDRNLRWFAGALEKASDHRVGRAVATLSARGKLTDVEVIDGVGIQGSVDRHPVRVGAPDWIGIDTSPTIWTTVGVEVDGRTLGSITVADDVRPDLTRDIGRLTALGLELVLVSGDTDERTRHVAGLAGISAFHADGGPDKTAQVVHTLAASGRVVATAGVVGGTDAALAIIRPDSAAGSAATIVADDLSPSRIARALELARTTAGRVRRAGRATVVLGALGVAVAAAGLLGPVGAAGVAAAVFGASAVVATSA